MQNIPGKRRDETLNASLETRGSIEIVSKLERWNRREVGESCRGNNEDRENWVKDTLRHRRRKHVD